MLQAKEVTAAQAEQTALTVLKQKNPGFSGSVSSISIIDNDGTKCYYIVNFTPQGWALISADDVVTPILGYSITGKFQQNGMPDNIKGWLSNYQNEISRVIAFNDGTPHKGWAALSVMSRSTTDKVEPLITVNWNQSKPYNTYCPYNASGTALVGCVAVAMGQAMSVAKYPTHASGEYSYTSATYGSIYINYDKEKAYDWDAILSGANSKDDVAHLLYHCGVAVQMDYGIDASGTQTSYMPGALKRNFSYPSSVTYYSRSSYSGDWKQLIVNELKAGRAVCYSGVDVKKSEGHCFNLDGYDGNTMFHVNWGWGGADNGYFPLDGLKDASMDADFTSSQGVVVGIRQPSEAPSDITLSNSSVKEKQAVGTVVGTLTVQSEATNSTYEYSVRGEYSSILHDYVNAPFTIVNGVLQTTKELSKDDSSEWNIDITAKNSKNNSSITKSFTIYVTSASGTEDSPASGVTLAYDKEKKTLTITSTKAVSYALFTADDNVIGEGDISANGNASVSLDGQTAKYCTLKLSNKVQSKNIKLIINK